jgi:hypothetical protein
MSFSGRYQVLESAMPTLVLYRFRYFDEIRPPLDLG